MKTIYDLITEHRFFETLSKDQIAFIASCGMNIHRKSGEYLAKEGQAAEHFYIIRKGLARVEVNVPPSGTHPIQTIREGEIAGWSWLFAPYEWSSDIRVIEDISAVALNGVCLRQKCENDHHLGFVLMKKFAEIFVQRLHATRLQLLDVYGKGQTHDT